MKNSVYVRLIPFLLSGLGVVILSGCDEDEIDSGSGLVYAIGDVIIDIIRAIASAF